MKKLGLVVVCLVALAGCSVGPEQKVRELAEARWQAMIEADYKKAWDYLAPGFRKRVPLEAYTLRFAGKTKWTSAKVEQVVCEEERCEVVVNTDYRYLGNAVFPAHDGKQEIKEVWIKVDGHWWHMPRK